MKKKDVKKEDKIYSAGEVISMIESFSDGMQVIAEGQTELVKKIDNLEVRFDGLEEQQKTLADGQEEIKARLNEFEKKTDKNFEVVFKYLSEVDDEIQELKILLKEKSEIKRLAELEKKFYKLEKLVLSKI